MDEWCQQTAASLIKSLHSSLNCYTLNQEVEGVSGRLVVVWSIPTAAIIGAVQLNLFFFLYVGILLILSIVASQDSFRCSDSVVAAF